LRNTIEKMVVLAHSDRLGVRDVPPNIRDAVRGRAPAARAGGGALADVERDRILTVLAGKQQNRSQAAVELGISRRTLIRKLNAYREQGLL
jgi:DNA-binding NtrC family response regulator